MPVEKFKNSEKVGIMNTDLNQCSGDNIQTKTSASKKDMLPPSSLFFPLL
ncbi:MAG: hypothetical protein PWQ51_2010 [Methanolobus sp.]|jgi:hypothetical protein|nr:hypothetical protein [Methanolobus sp.]